MPEASVQQSKVKWEVGGEMLTPAGTVEIHSDEGDVIGFVFPQYAAKIAAVPYLLQHLKAIVRLGDAHFDRAEKKIDAMARLAETAVAIAEGRASRSS